MATFVYDKTNDGNEKVAFRLSTYFYPSDFIHLKLTVMKATQQQSHSFIFNFALILIATSLILALPLIQQGWELVSEFLAEFLGAFKYEISQSYGR